MLLRAKRRPFVDCSLLAIMVPARPVHSLIFSSVGGIVDLNVGWVSVTFIIARVLGLPSACPSFLGRVGEETSNN